MKKIIVIFCWLNAFYSVYSNPPLICSNIITKTQWGSRDPSFVDYTVFPLDYVIIHHTVTDPCDSLSTCADIVSSIQNYHLDKQNWGDIGYNFLVGGDGNVYEGRGWHKVGAHTYGYNTRSIGIAFIGTFTKTVPSQKQLQAAKDLLQCGVESGELSEQYKLYGARQVGATESPGVKLFDKLKKWHHFATPESN